MNCADITLASASDCILELTFDYHVRNLGGAPVMVITFNRDRNGQTDSLLNDGMMLDIGPGEERTESETVQIDLCAAGPVGSVTMVQARAESLLQEGAECVGATEHTLIGPGFE